MKSKKIAGNIVRSLMLPVLLYAIFAIAAPQNFISLIGLRVIITSATVYTLIGWGVCFNLVVGTWDFSAGAAIAVAACLAADAGKNFGFGAMIIVAMVAVFVCEIITATVYRVLKIPTLITTIGMLLIYETFTSIYKGGKTISLPQSCKFFATFPNILILLVIGGVLFEILYNHTVFGHNVKAVGHGSAVAKTIGLNPTRVKFFCFVAGGVVLAVASVAYISYGGASTAKYNFATMSSIFSPMMGVTVGLALEKYCPLTIGVFIGEISIRIIAQGLIACGASSNVQQIVTGIALLAVFIFSAVSLKQSENAEKKERMKLMIND